MKQKIGICCILLLFIGIAVVHAGQFKARTGGIVFRGSYWDTNNDWAPIMKETQGLDETVYVGGYGGWMDFYSRIDDHLFLQCGLGLASDVMVSDEFLGTREVKVKAVTPLVFGVRYDLLAPENITAMQPYGSAGMGPYWEHQIHVIDEFGESDQVSVISKMRVGMYFGGGVFFRVSDTFVFNFDMKYHWVDMDTDNDFTGFELGIGFGFFWGNY